MAGQQRRVAGKEEATREVEEGSGREVVIGVSDVIVVAGGEANGWDRHGRSQPRSFASTGAVFSLSQQNAFPASFFTQSSSVCARPRSPGRHQILTLSIRLLCRNHDRILPRTRPDIDQVCQENLFYMHQIVSKQAQRVYADVLADELLCPTNQNPRTPQVPDDAFSHLSHAAPRGGRVVATALIPSRNAPEREIRA